MAAVAERANVMTFAEQREILGKIFDEWVAWPKIANFVIVPVMDDTNRHYLLIEEGWERGKRIHGVFVHIDLIDGKFWIQADHTEEGIATELLEAGVPKDKIVLAFKSIERRRMTEFAVE